MSTTGAPTEEQAQKALMTVCARLEEAGKVEQVLGVNPFERRAEIVGDVNQLLEVIEQYWYDVAVALSTLIHEIQERDMAVADVAVITSCSAAEMYEALLVDTRHVRAAAVLGYLVSLEGFSTSAKEREAGQFGGPALGDLVLRFNALVTAGIMLGPLEKVDPHMSVTLSGLEAAFARSLDGERTSCCSVVHDISTTLQRLGTEQEARV
jgi:hypothetical protein